MRFADELAAEGLVVRVAGQRHGLAAGLLDQRNDIARVFFLVRETVDRDIGVLAREGDRASHIGGRGAGGVAARLGNTVAVCRASYIHPAIFDAYESGALHARFKRAPDLIDEWIEDEKIVLSLFNKG